LRALQLCRFSTVCPTFRITAVHFQQCRLLHVQPIGHRHIPAERSLVSIPQSRTLPCVTRTVTLRFVRRQSVHQTLTQFYRHMQLARGKFEKCRDATCLLTQAPHRPHTAGSVHNWPLLIAEMAVVPCFTLTLPTADEPGPNSSPLPSVGVAAPW